MATIKNRLHQSKITNNCPECYNADGLEFIFSQEVNDNFFMVQPKDALIVSLHCDTCNTDIYPVSYTDDIELVYDYQRKLAEGKKQKFSLKTWAYIFIAFDVLIVGGIIYYTLQ